MTKELEFEMRTKTKGAALVDTQAQTSPELKQAITEYLTFMSSKLGFKVSSGQLLEKAVLRSSPWVRQRYKELRRNNTNANKVMDIKRTAHPISSDPSIN